jgi:hypothetical protein
MTVARALKPFGLFLLSDLLAQQLVFKTAVIR